MKVGYPDTMNSAAYQISPLKATEPSEAYKKLQAENKAASDRQEAFEKAIREKQSSSNTSGSGELQMLPEPKKKRTKAGKVIKGIRSAVKGVKKAVKARKERRNDGINDNPKAEQREIGRRTRKENKKQNKLDIKKQKARVTKERQDKRTAKATTRQTERLNKVTKKVGEKIEDVNKGTGLGISKNNPGVGNIVKDIVRKKNERSPAQYAETPINMITPKRRARRKKRVERIEAKIVKNSELKPIKGVADEDLQYTAKKGKEKKVARLSKKSNRISAKTTKILRDNNQVPSAKKKLVKKDYGRDLELIKKISKGPAKKKKTPVKFASNAQRKAVWASKNEKKKNK